MEMWIRRTAIAIAVAHTVLLAAYTLPQQVVPIRFRYWSQAYARVLFHQDWRLFAPDPPACGCSIMILDEPDSVPQRLEDLHSGFIWKRMASNACRYAEASIDRELGRITTGDALGRSLLKMTGRDPRKDGRRIDVHLCCACRGAGLWEVRFPQHLPE